MNSGDKEVWMFCSEQDADSHVSWYFYVCSAVNGLNSCINPAFILLNITMNLRTALLYSEILREP